MKQIFIFVIAVIGTVTAVALALTFLEVREERVTLSEDLAYRTQFRAEGLRESIELSYIDNSTEALQRLVDRFTDRERIAGLAVYDSSANPVALSANLPDDMVRSSHVGEAMDSDSPRSGLVSGAGGKFYVHAEPLHDEGRVVGAFAVMQDAGYIDVNIAGTWRDNLVSLLLQSLVISLAIAFLTRWLLFMPLARLADSVRAVRMGGNSNPESLRSGQWLLRPLESEISRITDSLTKARTVASEEARMRLEKLDSPWTAERLKEFVKAYLRNRPIYVVSNREPYIHEKTKGEIRYSVPASGMVTALESVMEACGGMWLAHGSGQADKETADAEGKLQVPPDEPKYTLKRVWLTPKDVQGFYTGFSNESVWPLCHMVHTRPVFRKEDWAAYKRVNGKFAEALLAEIKNVQQPIILVQDYHFALLPRMIKKSRPDAQVGLFWHIPWPSAEHFSICPWRKDILEGMLGADLIGFHTQQYCNNFLETVGKEVESLIDLELFSVTRDEHVSQIKPFPISIAFTNGKDSESVPEPDTHILEELGIFAEHLALGVERLDYTKGILERFKAVEFFLDANPDYRGKFVLLQIASPSREESERYREYAEKVEAEAERVNEKFGTNGWKPIRFEHRHHSHEELEALYKLARVCLVTSLHDGMNLVAKEYVAARDDEAGVLILSQFTGAARDLKGAIIVNPYSAEEVSAAIKTAFTMPPAEQHRRMKAMRNTLKSYNVYRWAAEFLRAVAALR